MYREMVQPEEIRILIETIPMRKIFCHASALRESNIKYLNEGQKLTCELIDSEDLGGNLKLVE